MTAVEWLEIEIVKLEKKHGIPGEIYQLCEQAKEMEKAQIIDSFDKGGGYPYNTGINHAEQYYNKTFKNK